MDERKVMTDLLILGGLSVPLIIACYKNLKDYYNKQRQLMNSDFTGSIMQTSDIPYLNRKEFTIESFNDSNLSGDLVINYFNIPR